MNEKGNITRIKTNSVPSCLKVSIKLKEPCKLRVFCINPVTRTAIYYDREFTAKLDNQLEIRLPQSSRQVDVVVICEKGDNIISSVKVKKVGLRQFPICYKTKKVREFIPFAQSIADKLPNLSVGEYKSAGGTFTIHVMDNIEGAGTPARIHNDLGFIQISKSKMGENTVPMTMAVLLHEYSHFYENVIQDDEIEADLNGLRIYLGLGYPILESHKSFTEVFDHADNPMNRERYDHIFAYVSKFNKLKHKTCI
jgi:hypothetical protein